MLSSLCQVDGKWALLSMHLIDECTLTQLDILQ
jgi:hypothetical protein